jgi:hypothetical protein
MSSPILYTIFEIEEIHAAFGQEVRQVEGCLYPQLSEERGDAGSRAPRHRGGPGGGTGHGPGTRSISIGNIWID